MQIRFDERVVIVTGAGGGLGRAYALDLARRGAKVAKTMARWGRIDALINNAGILRDAAFHKMSLADFRKVIDVHLMGSVICTHAVWPIMRAANYGVSCLPPPPSVSMGISGRRTMPLPKWPSSG